MELRETFLYKDAVKIKGEGRIMSMERRDEKM